MEWAGRHTGMCVPLMSRRLQLVPFVRQGHSKELDCCLMDASSRNYLALLPQYLVDVKCLGLDGQVVAPRLPHVSR